MHREGPAKRGEKFLPIPGDYVRDPAGERLVKGRKEAVQAYDLKESADDTRIMTFRLGRTHHDQIDRLNGDIETQHQVNFFEHITRRLTEQEGAKRFRVLLLGSGLGLFNDELRAEFGKKVDVKGISLVNERVLRRQKERLRAQAVVGTGPFEGATAEDDAALRPRRDRVTKVLREGSEETGRTRVPSDDAKWTSILDMRDYPEFDLMVDTFDELYYASKDTGSSDSTDRFDTFDWKLRAAIHKLNPGGELFIARIDHNPSHPQRSAMKHVWEAIPHLQKEEGVRIFIGGVAYEDILTGLKRTVPMIEELPFDEVALWLEKLSHDQAVDGSPSRGDSRDSMSRSSYHLPPLWCQRASLGVLPIKIVRNKESVHQSTTPVVPASFHHPSPKSSLRESVVGVKDAALETAKRFVRWIGHRLP